MLSEKEKDRYLSGGFLSAGLADCARLKKQGCEPSMCVQKKGNPVGYRNGDSFAVPLVFDGDLVFVSGTITGEFPPRYDVEVSRIRLVCSGKTASWMKKPNREALYRKVLFPDGKGNLPLARMEMVETVLPPLLALRINAVNSRGTDRRKVKEIEK